MATLFTPRSKAKPAAPVYAGPEEGQQVWLAFQDQIIAGIVGRDQLGLVVELQRAAPLQLPPRARVEYMSPQGVVRQRATLALTDRHSQWSVRLTPAGPAQLLLARHYLRADLSVPVIISRADGERIQTQTVNLSESGGLLAYTGTLRPSERVELSLLFDRYDSPLHTAAVVVRRTDDGCTGVHFTQISREESETLCWKIFAEVLAQRPRRASATA